MVKFDYHTDTKPATNHKEIAEKLDAMDMRKLDEDNPLEQAKKFDIVKNNPPKPEFMKVDLVKTHEDPPKIYSISKNEDGKEKRIQESPFFTIDLYSAIQANIAKCPSNVVPMLIDQAQQLVMNEKKEFRPEKRTSEFNWWWIVLGLMMLPGVILIILLFL